MTRAIKPSPRKNKKLFLYAKSAHNFGLDGVKRMVCLCKKLKEVLNLNPTLCVSDFKAQMYANSMGVNDVISLDMLRNMSNVMCKNDILIYESNEDVGSMKEDLQIFCSLVIKIDSNDFLLFDDLLYNYNKNKLKQTQERIIFFGDDDYTNTFLNIVQNSNKKHNINLLLGEYFFLNNDKFLKEFFNNTYESDEYLYALSHSKFVLSANVQTCLEARANGSIVMFFNREYESHRLRISKQTKELLKKYGIIISATTSFVNTKEKYNKTFFNDLILEFNLICDEYQILDDDVCNEQINELHLQNKININSIIDKVKYCL
jgi:hypothetical protein